jgi:hypothetical protein
VVEVDVPIHPLKPQFSMGDRFAYFCVGLFLAIFLYFRFGVQRSFSDI